MVEKFIREVHAALVEKRGIRVRVAGHVFSMNGEELKLAAIRELSEHAAAWAVIAREREMPWAIPLVPGVLIDDELFVNLPCRFLLSDDGKSCGVRIGDYDMTLAQDNGYVFHGQTGYLLRRTKKDAEELCIPSRISSW